jgi:phosphatidylinositol kinase/protein kinase (PI-3  family)
VSGHAPKLLQFYKNDGSSLQMVFKHDDIRPDFAVLQYFKILNNLWTLAGCSANCLTFDCFPLSKEFGLMEFVGSSVPLNEWACSKIAKFDPHQLKEFIRHAAGSYTAVFVLGIRDRHKDNLMIQNDLLLWQVCPFLSCFLLFCF